MDFSPAAHHHSITFRAKRFGHGLGHNTSGRPPFCYPPHLGGDAPLVWPFHLCFVRLIRGFPFVLAFWFSLLNLTGYSLCRPLYPFNDAKIPRFGTWPDCIIRLALLPLFISPLPSPNLCGYRINKGNSDGNMGSNVHILISKKNRSKRTRGICFITVLGFLTKENALDIISIGLWSHANTTLMLPMLHNYVFTSKIS